MATGNKALPLLSGREVVKTLGKFGWAKVTGRPGKGDHVVLDKPGHRATLSVPDHREVKRALLKGLLDDADITIDEFVAARRKRPKPATK